MSKELKKRRTVLVQGIVRAGRLEFVASPRRIQISVELRNVNVACCGNCSSVVKMYVENLLLVILSLASVKVRLISLSLSNMQSLVV